MPTPPPRTGSASWTAQHHRLSEGARQELISLLGLDPSAEPKDIEIANHALAEVEKWLGSYPGAESTLKGAPKAADFVRSSSSIENDTNKLRRKLKDAHQWVRDELARTGIDFQKLNQELDKLVNACRSIKGKYEGIESRGPPKKSALRHLILELREIFGQAYQGPILRRDKIGFVEPLNEYESREEEFIKFSLRDADIQYGQNLRRLLDEPNMTVQSGMRDRIIADTEARWAKDEERNSLEIRKK